MNEEVLEHKEALLVLVGIAPPLMLSEVIQLVIAFLSALASNEVMLALPVYQFSGVQPAATFAPRMDKASRIKVFPCPVLDSSMTGDKHDMLTNVLMMKTPTFIGSEIEYTFEFVVDCRSCIKWVFWSNMVLSL